MNRAEFKYHLSEYMQKNEPFLFITDFLGELFFISKLDKIYENDIMYDIRGQLNFIKKKHKITKPKFEIYPINKETYATAFNTVKRRILKGDSYLLNLTFPSKIKSNLSLQQIFEVSNAPYKIYMKDKFLSFSPECFIQIKDNFIYSYPMKGTIDASIENAEEILMNNSKEIWEHNTIVDLIRNDLSMVASNVTVMKYRYIDKIISNNKTILQTSSEIRGTLSKDWKNNLADILFKLLPAGSISGAPKQKTLEIIKEVEITPRNYYTGIFGIFDGENLDSAVTIRFIEKIGNDLYYRSGGGITFKSEVDEEYQELINKIYVPIV